MIHSPESAERAALLRIGLEGERLTNGLALFFARQPLESLRGFLDCAPEYPSHELGALEGIEAEHVGAAALGGEYVWCQAWFVDDGAITRAHGWLRRLRTSS